MYSTFPLLDNSDRSFQTREETVVRGENFS